MNICAPVLLSLATLALFLFQPATSAQQTYGNKYTQKEAENIDRLINDCRQSLSKGDFAAVARNAKTALSLSQKSGDKGRQARATSYIALAAYHSGRIDDAIEPFKKSAALAGEAGDRKLQLLSLNSAGVALREAGRYDDALYFFNHSLAIRREQKDRAGEAATLGSIADVYVDNGDFDRAERLYREALRLAGELNDKALEQIILFKSGSMERGRGNLDLALEYGEQALNRETEKTHVSLKMGVRDYLATVHTRLGDLEKAAELFEQALAFAKELKNPYIEGMALGRLAETQSRRGRHVESIEPLSKAIALLRRGGSNGTDESRFLLSLAETQRALGRNEEALSNYYQAIAVVERERERSVPAETSSASLLSAHRLKFASTIDFLLSRKQEAEALKVAESYHARAFLDVLAESKIDLRKELRPEQRAKEEDIFKRISSIQKQLWQESLSQEQERLLGTRLSEAEDELEAFQFDMRRTNPRYAGIKYLRPIEPEHIQRNLLDSETALIEYVLGPKRSYAWVVFKDKISSVPLPPQKDIEEQIINYRLSLHEKVSALTASRAIAEVASKSLGLYKAIFKPLEPHLSSARKLIIVPDGALAYIPFETLAAEAKQNSSPPYLVERFAIAYAPSASALAAIKAREAQSESKGLIAFGDPVYEKARAADASPEKSNEPNSDLYAERGLELRNLPFTRSEIDSISRLFPATDRQVFLGAEAREQRVKNEPLEKYRYIHFAAHGLVDEFRPARSGIALSLSDDAKEDGVLQMGEVMRLKLNADLVTLSACRTGLGKLYNGEGMIGLTRAFFYAGARSVVVSLWNVNDLATAELMKSFYGHLNRGLPKDEALRQAKLEMIKGRKRAWQHSYFWAPFVLIGERN